MSASLPKRRRRSFVVCDGNEAAAWAVSLARVDMVAVYPITPQSSLVEYLAKFVADGTLAAEIVDAEGEHSVLSVLAGRGARRRAHLHRHLRPGTRVHVRTVPAPAGAAAADGDVDRDPRHADTAERLGRTPGRDVGARGRLDPDVLRDRPGSARHRDHGLPHRRAPRRDAAGQCLPRRQLPLVWRDTCRSARTSGGGRVSRRALRQLARGARPRAADGGGPAHRRRRRAGTTHVRQVSEGPLCRDAERACGHHRHARGLGARHRQAARAAGGALPDGGCRRRPS